MEEITEMLKGLLEGAVLELIGQSDGETYGYAITQKLRALGFSDIVEGTVYTVTLRLEKKGLIAFEKKESTQGPARKFYHLTEAGQEERHHFWQKWDFVSEKLEDLRK